VASVYLSGYNHVLYLLILLMGIRGIDVDRAIRFDFCMRAALMLLILICGTTGIIKNYVTYRTLSNGPRYSLGFSHPNTLASLAFLLIVEDTWIRKRSFSIGYMLVEWAIAAVVYVVTLNRTAVLLMIIFPLLQWWTTRSMQRGPVKMWQHIACEAAFPGAAVMSYAMMLLSEKVMVFRLFDGLMSNRFSNAAEIYQRYGMTLLGQEVELISVRMARQFGTSIALLDVAYLRMLIQGGILVFLLMGWLYIRAVRDAVHKNDSYTLLVLCVLVLFGISESGYNNVCMNFALLLMARAAYTPFEEDVEEQWILEGII